MTAGDATGSVSGPRPSPEPHDSCVTGVEHPPRAGRSRSPRPANKGQLWGPRWVCELVCYFGAGEGSVGGGGTCARPARRAPSFVFPHGLAVGTAGLILHMRKPGLCDSKGRAEHAPGSCPLKRHRSAPKRHSLVQGPHVRTGAGVWPAHAAQQPELLQRHGAGGRRLGALGLTWKIQDSNTSRGFIGAAAARNLQS